MRMIGMAVAALAAAVPAAAAAPAAETIAYETGPCFGVCPIYRVTVSSDGIGLFEGIRFTAVTGRRSFTLSGWQYRTFARQLAPLRPRHGARNYSEGRCRSSATDLPSADVTWRSRRGTQSLHFYFGCDMERNRTIAERLRAAPRILPIGDFIGERR